MDNPLSSSQAELEPTAQAWLEAITFVLGEDRRRRPFIDEAVALVVSERNELRGRADKLAADRCELQEIVDDLKNQVDDLLAENNHLERRVGRLEDSLYA